MNRRFFGAIVCIVISATESVTIGSLNSLQKYYFTIDAFNENGIAKSKKLIELD